MSAMTYLHISGTLCENMVYRARPGYESSRRGRQGVGDPTFQLVLLDRDGRILVSVAPQVRPRGCGSAQRPLYRAVRGVLPLHPDATAYELRCGEIRLYGAAIPPAPPEIAKPTCGSSAHSCTLHWQPCKQAKDTGDQTAASEYGATARPITYSIVAAMNSGRRITVARGLRDLSYTVELGVLPVSGKGAIFLVANDGVRSSEVHAASIDVPLRPCTVHIIVPAAGGESIPFGQVLSVLGCCLDMSGQPCEPARTAWFLDGKRFATGTFVAALDDLQAGSHRLSFAFEPVGAERVEASVNVEIDEPDTYHHQWEALIAERP